MIDAILERTYPDPDCGCPVEEWLVSGLNVQLHFEDDGAMAAFIDAGDWDTEIILKATTMETARAEAFAWIEALPAES